MKLDNIKSVAEMAAFLDGSQAIAFAVSASKAERYHVVEKLLKRFNYPSLKRQEKGIVIQFLKKVTGYSRQQITRLIAQYAEHKKIRFHQKTVNGFETHYTNDDIKLLAKLDQRHDMPNGMRIKKLCERAYDVFGEVEYERLSTISVAHIYNLRKTKRYKKHHCQYTKTNSKKGVNIGERRKPNNGGKPGYLRIDTVHQGDLDGDKGVYHINAVDEVTQFEVVMSVEKISEYYLIPALEIILDTFPFEIINFHTDNGSEYVNKNVAKLLTNLFVEFTKSRPRKSNDNALAEGKNASVVRKTFGYGYIPQKYAERINEFNQDALNTYVNYHRPCLYLTFRNNKLHKN